MLCAIQSCHSRLSVQHGNKYCCWNGSRTNNSNTNNTQYYHKSSKCFHYSQIQSRPRLYTIRTTPKHELCLTPQQQIPAEFVVATHTRREESQPVCVEETDAKSPICSERNVIMPEQLTIHVRDGTHCSQDMAMADKKRYAYAYYTVHRDIIHTNRL